MEEYRIWFTQTDKTTGKCIGKGQSTQTYSTLEAATKDIPAFEFDNEKFKQEVAVIAPFNPFERFEPSYTDNEKIILDLLRLYLNYNDCEAELNDNAVGVYMKDITKRTTLTAQVARGVVSSLIQKDMLETDDVNGETLYRATDNCIRYLHGEC